jgi:hypothetical protein
MKNLKSLMLVSMIMFMTACAAGVNFKKMSEDQLVLGKTTKENIMLSMGKPNFKGAKTLNGVDLEVMTYAYAKVGGDAVLPGVTPARSQGLLFKDGVLVGKEYTSSFAEDNTVFDLTKAKSVVKGQKKSDVLTLLGSAKGEYIYPVVNDKTGYGLVYMFTQTKGFKSKSDVLVVEFNSSDIVTDVKLTSVGQL